MIRVEGRKRDNAHTLVDVDALSDDTLVWGRGHQVMSRRGAFS